MPADAVLAHGYTLSQVHHMAKAAVNLAGVYACDYLDRLDTAYGAIVVYLYEAPHWPTRHALIRSGAQAVSRMVEKDLRQRGYRRGNGFAGAGSAPRFAAYWDAYLVAPSHETRIVERVAVRQVLPRLTPRETQAVAALAAAGDYQAAADALHMNPSTFNDTIRRARRRILALWHEGETPRRQRTADIRIGNRVSGRATHCRKGHPYSPPTLAVQARAARVRGGYCPTCRQERKAAKEAGTYQTRTLQPCGTHAAWRRHQRQGTEVDAACLAARDAYLADYREQKRQRIAHAEVASA